MLRVELQSLDDCLLTPKLGQRFVTYRADHWLCGGRNRVTPNDKH